MAQAQVDGLLMEEAKNLDLDNVWKVSESEKNAIDLFLKDSIPEEHAGFAEKLDFSRITDSTPVGFRDPNGHQVILRKTPTRCSITLIHKLAPQISKLLAQRRRNTAEYKAQQKIWNKKPSVIAAKKRYNAHPLVRARRNTGDRLSRALRRLQNMDSSDKRQDALFERITKLRDNLDALRAQKVIWT